MRTVWNGSRIPSTEILECSKVFEIECWYSRSLERIDDNASRLAFVRAKGLMAFGLVISVTARSN